MSDTGSRELYYPGVKVPKTVHIEDENLVWEDDEQPPSK